MSLLKKNKSNSCTECCCGHHHSHEHEECKNNHSHDNSECGHSHSHGHGCDGHAHGCGCCEGKAIDVRKVIAGVAVFLAAMVVFHIPNLFKSFSETTIDNIELFTYLLIYLVTAKDIVTNAIKNVFKGKALDEQFLMTVASIGAFFVGDYPEGCAVMLFYLVGEAFQDYAVDKSRKSITELMDIRPDYANLIGKDGQTTKVDPNEVKVGELILVKPGEKVPLDGIVAEGFGSIDTAALTGESLPREVSKGEQIISGSICLNSTITVKVTKEFGESTVSKILDLVENASGKKAKTEKFITRFAKIYTPIVVGLALIIAVLPPLISSVAFGANIGDFYGIWNHWIYRALSFLVISCPCALVISVPLSFFAGVGAASTKGILIKGSNYLEQIANCDTVVFDKTGTLTKGVFSVAKVSDEKREKELLKNAAVAEIYTSHPIGRSIIDTLKNKYEEEYNDINKNKKNIQIEEIHGKGIKAVYNGDEILVGNSKLLKDANIDTPQVFEIGTIVYVVVNKKYLGYLVIADEIKDTSLEAIRKLNKLGVKNTVMLTGDRKEIAEYIGNEIGIGRIYSELLPSDKVEYVEELIKSSKGLVFVGDGINDAPVLARADIGIAMGAMGSDAAIEAADIVLMDDNPANIAKAIKIARKTLRIAKQNIVFALGVKILVLALAALGIATMWAAVFADVGVCVIAIVNAMRSAK